MMTDGESHCKPRESGGGLGADLLFGVIAAADHGAGFDMAEALILADALP
jgi:hypothetical protein